ncbi:MAG: ABC transporter permease [Patescibacteria group bacterium]|jgi:ABC-2 type transport system permease protein|nr:ABC transporter permease [Patescibacteria group bacterium]
MYQIYILWFRQIKKYFRSKSRIVGAIGQPLLFLLALGYGLGSVYKKAGDGNYLHFLVPGIMAQTVLFSAMFYGAMLIFDRQFGFLKETLVAPVSRLRIMIGGALGGATTATLQGFLVLVIAYIIGFRVSHIYMIFFALIIMFVLATAIATFSSGLGSFVQDMQGFQAINQFIIFPLYFLSGALYPLTNVPTWLRIIAEVNPISYTVDAMRYALINQTKFGLEKDIIALLITLVVCIAYGVWQFRRIQT